MTNGQQSTTTIPGLTSERPGGNRSAMSRRIRVFADVVRRLSVTQDLWNSGEFHDVSTAPRSCRVCLLLMLAMAAGCGIPDEAQEVSAADQARKVAAGSAGTIRLTPSELRRKLRANERAKFQMSGGEIVEAGLFKSGVQSIEALRGLPLRAVDLGQTPVSDLSPLAGMALQTLDLEDTQVADLSVVRGMPLKVLKLQNTKVTDFTPLAGLSLEQLNLLNLPFSDVSLLNEMPLKILWLAGTSVTDLSGLNSRTLESLDIENTQVRSLEPLAGMITLRRLNIASSAVTDVTPLKDLRLERLVLSPEKIQTGMEVLRDMKSLVLIQTSVADEKSAESFWKSYDLGVWKPAPAELNATSDAATPVGPDVEQPAAPPVEPADPQP